MHRTPYRGFVCTPGGYRTTVLVEHYVCTDMDMESCKIFCYPSR